MKRRSAASSPVPEAKTSSRPTREQAFDAFCTLLAFVAGDGATPATYSANALPPGVSRGAFLERHRQRVAAGVEGWTRAGQARTVTHAAWDLDVGQETARQRRGKPAPPVVANDAADPLDAALGIRIRRAR